MKYKLIIYKNVPIPKIHKVNHKNSFTYKFMRAIKNGTIQVGDMVVSHTDASNIRQRLYSMNILIKVRLNTATNMYNIWRTK